MTDISDDSDDATNEDRTVDSDSVDATAVSATYKVLGALTDATGAGVLGRNDATSGTPIGVEGTVPNASGGYGLSTPDDAAVGGTLETGTLAVTSGNVRSPSGTYLLLHTDGGRRALRLGVPTTESVREAGGNVVAGHPDNTVNNGAVGATIGGGGADIDANTVGGHYGTVAGGRDNAASVQGTTVGGGYDNDVLSYYGVVSGGSANRAGSADDPNSGTYAAVCGGINNTASGMRSVVGGGDDNTASAGRSTVSGGGDNTASGGGATIGGGRRNTSSGGAATVGGGHDNVASDQTTTVVGGSNNTASGQSATVAGGSNNTASGLRSFAVGHQARTETVDGVPHDGTFVWGDSSSDVVRSSNSDQVIFQAGGSRSSGPAVELYSRSDGSAGVRLDANDGTWQSLSSRAAKTDIDPIDGRDSLADVDRLEISTWRYRGQDDSVRHAGPMAEQFRDVFGLGSSDETISALDTAGVALSAIQGLSERLDDRDERIDDLEAETAALRAENVALRDRLDALESHVSGDDTSAAH